MCWDVCSVVGCVLNVICGIVVDTVSGQHL